MSKTNKKASEISDTISSETMITYIDVDKIDPHPHNPRKDVGDVTELADSIKNNGIMQNLTVVPWFSATTGQPADDNSMDGYYRALIGHRRLAAAKLAGLEKVPCVIAKDLTMSEQVSIMLAENMQRADLTTLEQAEGIQLMFDLGDTVDSVAKKTGLSASTVRRRAKLMEYDHDAVKESFDRGATLADYDALEKVKSPEKRAELIKEIGTNNFNWKLNNAISEENRQEYFAKVTEMLDKFAERIETVDWSRMTTCCSYYYNAAKDQTVEMPSDYDEGKKYYYAVPQSIYGSITLYVEKDQTEEKSTETEQRNTEAEKRKERIARLNEITDQMRDRRIDFVRNFKAFPTKKTADILETVYRIISILLIYSCSYENEYDLDDATRLLGFDLDEYFERGGDDSDDEKLLASILDEMNVSGAQRLVYYVFLKMNYDFSTFNYYTGIYEKRNSFIVLYDFLQFCGYELSDEEQAILDGTHELYTVAEAKE